MPHVKEPQNYSSRQKRKLSSNTQYSSEEIIDLMEKEQEAIVVKLMKEINSLREENKLLKAQLNSAPGYILSKPHSTSAPYAACGSSSSDGSTSANRSRSFSCASVSKYTLQKSTRHHSFNA